jgi:uncharacterized protein
MLDIPSILALLGVGLFAGLTAGLFGVGGGLIQVPVYSWLFAALHFPEAHRIKMAIGTAGASILFTSISSIRAHHQAGAVQWQIVQRIVPGLVLGAIVGSKLADVLMGKALAIIFVCFVAFSATQMLLDRKPKASRQLPGTAGLSIVGAITGFLSSLIGAGGGFVSVPFMTWCNVPTKQAVATSSALGFPIALGIALGYVMYGWDITNLPQGSLGYIYVPALACVVISSIPMAPVGAKLAHRLPVKRLKQLFSGVLYMLAINMLFKHVLI